MDLPSLYTMLFPKLPSMNLQNTLLINMFFHTTLILIKEFILQQLKGGNGLIFMEHTGFTMLPTNLK